MADKEYIEREAVISEINEKIGHIGFTSPYQNEIHLIVDGLERARDSVEDAPAVDVVEVRHGEWIHTDRAMSWRGKDECSECHYHTADRIDLSYFNYCPSCGAKMDRK